MRRRSPAIAAAMTGDTKRDHDRVPFAVPLRVSTPTQFQGMGIDLGMDGIAVHMAEHVAEGSTVEVEAVGDGTSIKGTVPRTTPHAEGGFRLGIQFHEENGVLAIPLDGPDEVGRPARQVPRRTIQFPRIVLA